LRIGDHERRVLVGQTAGTSLFDGNALHRPGPATGTTYLPGAAGMKPKLEVFSIGPTDRAFGNALGSQAEGVVEGERGLSSPRSRGRSTARPRTRRLRRTPRRRCSRPRSIG